MAGHDVRTGLPLSDYAVTGGEAGPQHRQLQTCDQQGLLRHDLPIGKLVGRFAASLGAPRTMLDAPVLWGAQLARCR